MGEYWFTKNKTWGTLRWVLSANVWHALLWINIPQILAWPARHEQCTHCYLHTPLLHPVKSNQSVFKPFLVFTSPSVAFNVSYISEVSVRCQGCQWPFLAGLWTPHCCWGGSRTRRLRSAWQLIGHVHQRCQIEPEEGSECLLPTDNPGGMQRVYPIFLCCIKKFILFYVIFGWNCVLNNIKYHQIDDTMSTQHAAFLKLNSSMQFVCIFSLVKMLNCLNHLLITLFVFLLSFSSCKVMLIPDAFTILH